MKKALSKAGGFTALQQAHAAPKQAPKVKAVILDTGDGCTTDASVKVKPHKTDHRKVVLKCVSPQRLAAAAAAMKLKPCGPLIKGSKHFILICWANAVQHALGYGSPVPAALEAPAGAMVVMSPGKKAVVVK